MAFAVFKSHERKSANAARMYPFAGRLTNADLVNFAAIVAGPK